MMKEKRRVSLASLLVGVSVAMGVFLIHSPHVSAKEFSDAGGPPAPTGLRLQDGNDNNVTDSSVLLRWAELGGGIKYYKVYYSKSGIFDDVTTPFKVSFVGTNVDVGSLTHSTPYFFKVASVDELGREGINSDPLIVLVKRNPSAPQSILISATPSTTPAISLRVDYYGAVNYGDSYKIYRSTDNVNFSFVSTDRFFIDKTITPGIRYYYKAKYVRDDGRESEFTKTVDAVYGKENTPPQLIRLTGSALSSSEVSLSWNKIDGADSYNVYRSDSPLFPNYKRIANVPSGFLVFNYLDKGLNPDTQYSYYVTPYALASGEGEQSNITYVRTLAAEPSPRLVKFKALTINTSTIEILDPEFPSMPIGVPLLRWKLYRSLDGVNYTFVDDVNDRHANVITYDYGLRPDTLYYYKITVLGHDDVESSLATAPVASARTSPEGILAPAPVDEMRLAPQPFVKETPTESNVSSMIELLDTPDSVIKPGTTINIKYSYQNPTSRTQYVRLTRELVNSSGKVVARVSSIRNIGAGKDITVATRQLMSKNFAEGSYIMRVKITDRLTGKVLDQNSFDFRISSQPLSYAAPLDSWMPPRGGWGY